MKVIEYPPRKDWSQILRRPVLDNASLETTISSILKEVKNSGDKALIEFTWKFDKVKVSSLLVSPEEFKKAKDEVPEHLKEAVKTAFQNIEKFHLSQKEEEKKIETSPGVVCWRKSVAIGKVGIYIPGGTAPLFSTILMLGIPAKIAGCEEVILCTPPDKEGNVNSAILYTADLLGIKKVYKAGGAQAIAAMAYGTESIPKVYKIFGPGNQYVTAAKQMVSKEGVAIDMPAGPSEVAVLADASCDPSFVAADLLSQAEHGADSQVVLVTDDKSVIAQVKTEVEKQLKQLPRKEIAAKALENSLYLLVKDMDEAMELMNEYAPEHLILQVKNADLLAAKVINAGSVFIGPYSPEAAGDYASGTNHTLPTNGYAKAYSGVSLDSFIKKITFQKISQEGIQKLGPAIEIMAESEGLSAHKNAVSVRIGKGNRS
jgi:histidinol dehydrogenase